MTNLGFSPSRWLARHRATLGAGAVTLGLLTSGGCASQTTFGVGGEAGSSSTTTSSDTSTTTSTTTGTGGSGGDTTTTTSSTSTTTTTTTTTSSSSTTTTSSSSTTGTGGDGGSGGSGGSTATWTQPPGTADYPAEVEQNNLKTTANALAAGTRGFTAAIYPQGDVDNFEFEITAAGTNVTVSTSDGQGGCPAGAKTFVRVFDANNSVLASTGTSVSCANLTPAGNSGLSDLPAGKYYVRVESANINEIPLYVLDIKLAPPGCADGTVQLALGEQCDDGNSVSGDGCSAGCKLESGNFLNEIEPNNTQPNGNLLDGYAGAVGSINPLADADWYTFNVTVAGSSVTAEVDDGFGGCPGSFDSEIRLYSPAGVELVSDDDDGAAACSKIGPGLDVGTTNLAVGLYAIKVVRLNNSATQPFYVLKLKVTPPGCGDGILQTGEQCDDSNTAAGDGCSPTCQFEKAFAPETEVNDTQSLANPLPPGFDGFIASISPVGDRDYFSFDVTTPGSSVTINTSNGLGGCPAGFDSRIFLYDPAGTQIAVNNDGDVSPCSTISPANSAGANNLQPGTYRVRVERFGDNDVQPVYVVTIKISAPGCGDGVQQSGEQCDDNNLTDGDGCSSTCMAEAPYEIEPNNSTATATPQWPTFTTWKAAINPLLDQDYFSFTLTAVSSITAVTHDANNPNTCAFDTMMYLLGPTGTQLAKDDDDGPGSCSKIDPVNDTGAKNLQPGTYYLWVHQYDNTKTIPLYQLDLTIQ